jgi:hypothetical protein
VSGPVRWLLVAAALAGTATGCGGSEGGAAPASARAPAVTAAASPAVPSPAAMERSRFLGLLASNGDAAVLHRDGWTDARLEALFHRACDDIHHGASVDDSFATYQREVSAGPDADALASAFADAWGAGLVAFCPDVTGR